MNYNPWLSIIHDINGLGNNAIDNAKLEQERYKHIERLEEEVKKNPIEDIDILFILSALKRISLQRFHELKKNNLKESKRLQQEFLQKWNTLHNKLNRWWQANREPGLSEGHNTNHHNVSWESHPQHIPEVFPYLSDIAKHIIGFGFGWERKRPLQGKAILGEGLENVAITQSIITYLEEAAKRGMLSGVNNNSEFMRITFSSQDLGKVTLSAVYHESNEGIWFINRRKITSATVVCSGQVSADLVDRITKLKL